VRTEGSRLADGARVVQQFEDDASNQSLEATLLDNLAPRRRRAEMGGPGFEPAGVGAPTAAADVGQLRWAVGAVDERLLELLGEGGISAGGVSDRTGRHAHLPAGLSAAEADGNHGAKRMAALAIEDPRAAAGTPGRRWLRRGSG
jgi:hypothetical protein